MSANGTWNATFTHAGRDYDVVLLAHNGTVAGVSAEHNYVLTGKYVISQGTLSATVTYWGPRGLNDAIDGELRVALTTKSAFRGTMTYDGRSNVLSARYNGTSNTVAKLADIQGVWQMTNATLTIAADGTSFSQDDTGCASTGQFSETGQNAYAVRATFSGCGEAFNGTHYGLADAGANQKLVVVERLDGNSIFTLAASRNGALGVFASGPSDNVQGRAVR